MSGGSLDYVYGRVERLAEEVEQLAKTPLHRAFAAHLAKVACALHDLEWVLSGDYSAGDEVEAIRAVLPEGAELQTVVDEAKEIYDNLGGMLEELDKKDNKASEPPLPSLWSFLPGSLILKE